MAKLDVARIADGPIDGSFQKHELPGLMMRLAGSQRSGRLSLTEAPKVRRVITFADGFPTSAGSSIISEQLGARMLDRGIITPVQEIEIDGVMRSEKLQFGSAMVKLGLLSRDKLRKTLKWHHGWLLVRCLGASATRAAFESSAKVPREAGALSLLNFIEEGIRAYDAEEILALVEQFEGWRFVVAEEQSTLAQQLGCSSSLTQLLEISIGGARSFNDLVACSEDDHPSVPALTLVLTGLAASQQGEHPREKETALDDVDAMLATLAATTGRAEGPDEAAEQLVDLPTVEAPVGPADEPLFGDLQHAPGEDGAELFDEREADDDLSVDSLLAQESEEQSSEPEHEVSADALAVDDGPGATEDSGVDISMDAIMETPAEAEAEAATALDLDETLDVTVGSAPDAEPPSDEASINAFAVAVADEQDASSAEAVPEEEPNSLGTQLGLDEGLFEEPTEAPAPQTEASEGDGLDMSAFNIAATAAPSIPADTDEPKSAAVPLVTPMPAAGVVTVRREVNRKITVMASLFTLVVGFAGGTATTLFLWPERAWRPRQVGAGAQNDGKGSGDSPPAGKAQPGSNQADAGGKSGAGHNSGGASATTGADKQAGQASDADGQDRDAEAKAQAEAKAKAATAAQARKEEAAAQARQEKAEKHIERGHKFIRRRKIERAIDAYKKAATFDPDNGIAHRSLGIAYTMNGSPDRAINEYKVYLKLLPDAEDGPQIRQMIEGYEQQQ